MKLTAADKVFIILRDDPRKILVMEEIREEYKKRFGEIPSKKHLDDGLLLAKRKGTIIRRALGTYQAIKPI